MAHSRAARWSIDDEPAAADVAGRRVCHRERKTCRNHRVDRGSRIFCCVLVAGKAFFLVVDDQARSPGLRHLDHRGSQGHEALVDRRFAEGGLDEIVHGLLEQGRRAEDSFHDGAGRLTGPKAGDTVLPAEKAGGVFDRTGQSLRRQLEVDLEAGLGEERIGGLHRGRL